ncbi:hypothetical protein SAMN04488514_11087 [Kriegella aquimaris]|uniref:Uncharacterized protein n=1 Tax=Kriegella aquimaris TaxID=192904 RepID=A0A1G9U388_9FLAO|nr:hypothetical protein SAMN04488514_11087 [Kriegella aquimaris]
MFVIRLYAIVYRSAALKVLGVGLLWKEIIKNKSIIFLMIEYFRNEILTYICIPLNNGRW